MSLNLKGREGARRGVGGLSSWLALPLLALPLLTGCPVYGTREAQDAGPCVAGEQSSASTSACQCKSLEVLEVGDPIPGIDDTLAPRKGGTLRIHLDANLPSLNRIRHSDSWLKNILHQDVYQSMIRQNPRSYAFEPLLAEQWTSNELGTEWTFKLRSDVKWHDGMPLTSKDVKFTLDTILNPNNRTEHIRADWQDVLAPQNAYEAPDPYTFVIRLKRPVAQFLANVEDMEILPEHVFSRGDFNEHPGLRKPVGTGPFRFVKWDADSIVLERNPGYWGQQAYLDGLEYRVVTDRDTAFAMLSRGDLDFMDRLQPEMRTNRLTDELLKRYRLIDLVPSQYSFFTYNTARPQFADKRTRQAMTMLIDREQLLCEIYRCQGVQVTGPVQRRHPAYDTSLKPYPFDPTRAAQLLEEAGWKDGDGDGVREKVIDGQTVPFRVTFLLTQSSRTLEQSITVVQNAARSVGVEILISKIDWSVFTERLRKHDYDFAGLLWILNHEPDLFPLFSIQSATDGQNYGQFKNETVDKLVSESRFVMDTTTRHAVLRRVHQLLYEEQPYTWLFAQTRPGLMRADVQGVYTSDHWYQEYDMWINDPRYPEVPAAERHTLAPLLGGQK